MSCRLAAAGRHCGPGAVQVGGDRRQVPRRSRNGDEQRDAALVRLAADGQSEGVVTGDGPPGEYTEAAVADRRRRVGLVVMGEAECGAEASRLRAAGEFGPCLLDG